MTNETDSQSVDCVNRKFGAWMSKVKVTVTSCYRKRDTLGLLIGNFIASGTIPLYSLKNVLDFSGQGHIGFKKLCFWPLECDLKTA